MNNRYNVLRCGAIDGIARGLLLFFVGELTGSSYLADHFRWAIMLSCICALLSSVVFFVVNKGRPKQSIAIYGIGEGVFLLCALGIFCNDVQLKFHIFPQQEMYYGEAMELFAVFGLYVLLSEVFRIFVLLLKLLTAGQKC